MPRGPRRCVLVLRTRLALGVMTMATTAAYFTAGEWSSGPDLLNESWRDREDITQPLQRLGYEKFTTIGYVDVPLGLGIAVYSRAEEPRFLIEVEGSSGTTEHIYAGQLRDALELLAKYTPIVQAATIAFVVNSAIHADLGNINTLDGLQQALIEALPSS